MVAEDLGSGFETTFANNISEFTGNEIHRNGTQIKKIISGSCEKLDGNHCNGNLPHCINNNLCDDNKHKESISSGDDVSKDNDTNKVTQVKHVRRKIIPEKVFVERSSLMTDMLQVKEYQGLYNIFVAITINLLVYVFLMDVFETGTIDLGVNHLMSQFGKPLNVLSLLAFMHLSSSVILYSLVQQWATRRPQTNSVKLFWDLAFGIFGVIFFGFFFYIPIKANWSDTLPEASASIIVIEQLRLIMKMYSFLRVNVPRALYFDNVNCVNPAGLEETTTTKQSNGTVGNQQCFNAIHDRHSHYLKNMAEDTLRLRNGKSSSMSATQDAVPPNGISVNAEETKPQAIVGYCPEFSKYVYFLYAPTFIYRDSYPRTKEIRWNFVLRNIGETLGCILLYNLVQRVCGFVLFTDFGLPGHSYSVKKLISLVFTQMIPGGMGFVVGFFVLLHTTQNIFAEMLRFGDRMFYKDWWNSDSFSEFYRLWNIPVHDFLYTYIYKETKDRGIGDKYKAVPALLVFTISSLFHEYIFIYNLRFCYPVLLVMFGGFGVVFAFMPKGKTRSMGNIFIWWSLFTGNGLILALYKLEYYARVNGCPPADNQIADFFIPRSWTCGAITLY